MRFAATAFEYRFRFVIHGLIYMLGFAAPWHQPAWSFFRSGSGWFYLANELSKPSYARFDLWWNAVLGVMLLFAIAGAALRTWGSAYLGAQTVYQGGMRGDRVIAEGPYRWVRNPLYLGTILNTVAIAMLMRPEAGLLTLMLIIAEQYRLILREEPYLAHKMPASYEAYRSLVPRLIPSLRPRVARSGEYRPDLIQGALSEVYVIGCAVALAAFGWSHGFGWEESLHHITRALVISLGLSLVARAFVRTEPTPAPAGTRS